VTEDALRPSPEFYDRLAPSFDEFFAVPHRRVYDDLAWELITALPIAGPGVVLDLGCGTARWAPRFEAAGWRYVGVDDAPQMVAAARAAHPNAEIIEASMDDVDLAPACADLVIAMGSLQYSRDPAALARRMAAWAKPDAFVCVLVDSFLGLLLELVGNGRLAEARERAATRRSRWLLDGAAVEYALLDAGALAALFDAAGFTDVRTSGLLVGLTALGRERWGEQYTADPEATLARERFLSAQAVAADAGKHVLLTARAVAPPS
jgi:SAM-dependent methyltransferase